MKEILSTLMLRSSVRAGAAFLLLLALAIAAGAIWLPGYEVQDAGSALQSPSGAHWLGTDSLGRDLLSRTLTGGALSLAVGVFAALLSFLLGLSYGGLAGYLGGRMGAILMRVADALYALPLFLLGAILILVFGRGPFGVILALGLTGWVGEARLARVLVAQAKGLPYVESARSLGLTPLRIFWFHILPNVMGPLTVSITLAISQNILAESFLSFVGLGLEPPFASWGTLANEGWRAFRAYPHLILAPGAALFCTALAFTLIGDGLRDALDPRGRLSYLKVRAP
ncbi:MAG: ABC transporter permease [Proteobacteria bacterium]|nr:MAG: ABC transporter permease [Pseudomonadota bacterium]